MLERGDCRVCRVCCVCCCGCCTSVRVASRSGDDPDGSDERLAPNPANEEVDVDDPASSTLGWGVTDRGDPAAAAAATAASKDCRLLWIGVVVVTLGYCGAPSRIAARSMGFEKRAWLFVVELRMLFARWRLRRRLSWSGIERGVCVEPCGFIAAHSSCLCMLCLSGLVSVRLDAVVQGLPHSGLRLL